MKTSSARVSHAIAGLFGVVLLSSCNASSVPSNTPLTQQPALRALTSLSVMPAQAVHPDRRKTWVSPDANRAAQLAFAADDSTGDIDIFSLPDFKLKGTVTGFSDTQGACSDSSGNVWLANTGTEQMIELSRSGKVIRSLTDSVGYPVDCAIDQSGDLAVTDIFGFSGAGQVLFYKNATGTPTELSNSSQYYYYFDGFDPKGNLYVSGKTSAGSYILSECAAGGTSCSTITISGGTIYFPGMVQWYKAGKYLAAGDQLCGDADSFCLYSVQISGSQGTIKGTTTFSNPSGSQNCAVAGELYPPAEKYLVATAVCGYTGGAYLGRWHYPAGGKPKNSITFSGAGVVISVKK